MKKKTYVLTLSKTYMKGHQRQGEPTDFKAKYLSGDKIHTIRKGKYWKKVVDAVNAGTAVLSVRDWSGKPYASKQVEIGQLDKLGWQPIKTVAYRVYLNNASRQTRFSVRHLLAKNDGLSLIDFQQWFKMPKDDFEGGIIHFTGFRY